MAVRAPALNAVIGENFKGIARKSPQLGNQKPRRSLGWTGFPLGFGRIFGKRSYWPHVVTSSAEDFFVLASAPSLQTATRRPLRLLATAPDWPVETDFRISS